MHVRSYDVLLRHEIKLCLSSCASAADLATNYNKLKFGYLYLAGSTHRSHFGYPVNRGQTYTIHTHYIHTTHMTNIMLPQPLLYIP